VLRLHGREEVIPEMELEGEKSGTRSNPTEDEHIANEAAADFCVPKKMMDGFLARKGVCNGGATDNDPVPGGAADHPSL
jgi:hypothetical protein